MNCEKCREFMSECVYRLVKTPMPGYYQDPIEISKQMRINVDILKQELSDHIDNELKRFNQTIGNKKITLTIED